MSAYYNEIDPYAAQWLRNLIAAGHIAPGDVDERSIVDVRADELRGYTQCHFFAGIGVWSYALRRAGWPDDRSVWTGSCPCQPFSVSGKGLGHEDERHLWPAWFGLIGESRPVRILGEQVADGDGYAWLDDVGHDVESIGYALGAVCSAACGFGAPNERQRLYFVADADGDGCEQGSEGRNAMGHGQTTQPDRRPFILGNPAIDGSGTFDGKPGPGGGPEKPAGGSGVPCDMGHAQHAGLEGHGGHGDRGNQPRRVDADPAGSAAAAGFSGAVRGFWSEADWIYCRDPDGPRWRPVERRSFPLAAGAPSRVGRLRAYGNAINAEQAAHFIRAAEEVMP